MAAVMRSKGACYAQCMEMRRYKSQFNYGGADADDRPLCLSERDLRILRLLDPEYGYHYLPSNWIQAFVDGDELRVAKRLGRLARQPHGYLIRRQQWYKHAVYARSAKADLHLGERRARDRDPFAHRLLEDLTQASIAIGIRAYPDLELVPWTRLVATGKVPATTLDSPEPHAIVLSAGKLIPDGKPFAIRHGSRWRFILGKEIDRGTEPLASRAARRSIRQKLERYADCFSGKLYTRHYGFPNSVVLFVVTSHARMNSMMRLCADVIGPCSYLLFAHTTDWAHAPRYPPPNGDMLGPYQRVDHPPMHLAAFGDD